MIIGPAGKGPVNRKVEIEKEEDAYRIFGEEGSLADDIALAIRGADIGSDVADNRRFGLVKAIRTQTGDPASLTLTDANGNDVLEMKTSAPGRDANGWAVDKTVNRYEIYDPEAPAGENVTSFAVNENAVNVASSISTPTQLAAAIREAFGGRLQVESKQHDAHFEVRVNDQFATDYAQLATDGSSLTFPSTSDIDGESFEVGDQVLVKDQSTSSENGLYEVVDDSGTPTIESSSKLKDLNALESEQVKVLGGTNNADKLFTYDGSSFVDLSIDLTVDSGASQTSVDFSGVGNEEMYQLRSGDTTWIGGKAAYFASPSSSMEAHRRVLSPDNEDARVYAITAGQAVTAPNGNQTIRIPGLADTSQVGVGNTNTLLNIRTSGDKHSRPVSLEEAGQRDGNAVSEGYYQAREQYAGRFDVTECVQDDMTTVTAKVASQSDIDLSSYPKASPTIDSESITDGDTVLLISQDDETENGLYGAVDASGDVDLNLLQDRSMLANEKVEISSGSDSGQVYTYDPASGDFVEPQAIKITFEAPNGIADDAGTLTDKYVQSLGISNPSTAELERYSSDRLGDTFSYDHPVKLGLAPIEDENDVTEITLDLSSGNYSSNDADVSASLDWSDGTGELLLDKSEFEDLYGSEFDDGHVFVGYDSCVFDLYEKSSEAQLNPATDRLEYAADGFDVKFNQTLRHDLVIRGLSVTQYRLGNDVLVNRTDTGNEFVFQGNTQPGEAGGQIGNMETILGFDYTFEPDFPTVASKTNFSGGSSGVNASKEEKLAALDEALEENPQEDYAFIVASGLHADEMGVDRAAVTGATTEKPLGVLDVLEEHQDRQSDDGASGVVIASLEPMEPSAAPNIYSSQQKRERYNEILSQGNPGEVTSGSIIQGESRPQFIFFDAPFAANVDGRTIETSGAALFAGIRSALPNDKAIYEVDLPTGQFRPLYRYDVGNVDMPEGLANARVNTWQVDQNVVSLATEVTGAGPQQTSSGATAPSNFQSGVVMLATKEYQRAATDELKNLIGGMGTGPETLRAKAESTLKGVAQRTKGVQGLYRFQPQRDIQVQAKGGSSVGLEIDVTVVTLGEVVEISLTVGSITQTQAQGAGQNQGAVPTAQ